MAAVFHFQLESVDNHGAARAGWLTTTHGTATTPLFMPVGTQATVKGMTIDQLQATGAQVLLGNTYHLTLRPGEQLIAGLGGLHQFMGWPGPILTDSGGFQVYSLAANTKITEQGALFQSHIDGRRVMLTPERSMEIQQALGSDIAMVLDHVVGLPCPKSELREATERSLRWAERCRRHHRHPYQVVFGIVQGGLDAELRERSAQGLVELEFPGYAVGGLSVGEPPAEMYRVLDLVCPLLPPERPRYLMGVGRPEDLVEGIAPRDRHVRLRDAHPQRQECLGVHRSGATPLAESATCRRPAAAERRLPLPGLPPQPGVSAAFIHGQGNAGADPADGSQSDLLPAAGQRRAHGHPGWPV